MNQPKSQPNSRPKPPPIRKNRNPLPRRRLKPVGDSRARQLHRGGKVRKELSAGGVAVRQDGEQFLVALLKTEHKRGEVWVLPKGHVELHAGEKISEAARREVMEEAGLTDLAVRDQLGVTRFRFQVEDGMVFKTVHYFLMMTGQKQLTPQAEEGLLEARWFPIREAVAALEYDTDQDIVARAAEKLGVRGIVVPKPVRRRSNGPHSAPAFAKATAGKKASRGKLHSVRASRGRRSPRIHH